MCSITSTQETNSWMHPKLQERSLLDIPVESFRGYLFYLSRILFWVDSISNIIQRSYMWKASSHIVSAKHQGQNTSCTQSTNLSFTVYVAFCSHSLVQGGTVCIVSVLVITTSSNAWTTIFAILLVG
jgi:hypothetical protein